MRKIAVCWAIVFLFSAPGMSAEYKSACMTCHEFLGGALARPAAEWRGSIHGQNEVTCDLCHGGNPAVRLGDLRKLSRQQFADRQSRAMSRVHGFVGKPSGKALFDACAPCHPDSVERYARSIMGKAYLGGKGGPSCIACHNAHNIAMPKVPDVCKKCHKDTSGFDRIDPMNVTESTVSGLSGIRIKLKQQQAIGSRPAFIPEFPEDLEAFQIGFVAFGAVVVMFGIGYLTYRMIEKRR